MTQHAPTNSAVELVHALFLGAALAVFFFILMWAGDASGYFPPAGDIIHFMTNASDARASDAFWHGARSAALSGAVLGALIFLCADALSRLKK